MSAATPRVELLGLPYDRSSSFMEGAALAPDRIREALASASSNRYSELGVEIAERGGVHDAGDVDLSGDGVRGVIETALAARLDTGVRVLSLGGDHSVTYPILRAHGPRYPGLTLLHLDAHADLYDEFERDRYSHACPFARIMEEGLAARLVQVGIRTLEPHQREQAARFGVEIVGMADLDRLDGLGLEGPVYLSLDLDVLDPAFAPGVSHHEPGGMSTRQAIEIVHRLPAPVVGADVVELNPHRDPQGITAMAAAKLVKGIASVMLREDA